MKVKTYWVVVRRANTELLRALTLGFYRRGGFRVIADRRSGIDRSARKREERRAPENWGPDDFLVAEHLQSPPAGERRQVPVNPA